MIYIELYYGLQIFWHYKLIWCKSSKKKGILQIQNPLFYRKSFFIKIGLTMSPFYLLFQLE